MTGRTTSPRLRAGILGPLLGLALVLLAGPVATGGEPAPGDHDDVAWAIRPVAGADSGERPNFRHHATPGQSIEDALVVTNRGVGPLTLAVYAADGTPSSGLVDLAPAGAVPVALGAWVELEATRLTLAPGESAEVWFRIDVPTDAAPGEWAGGIVTSHLAPGDDPGVAVDRRLAASVVVDVAGAAEPPASSGEARRIAVPVLVGLALAAAVTWLVVLRGRARG